MYAGGRKIGLERVNVIEKPYITIDRQSTVQNLRSGSSTESEETNRLLFSSFKALMFTNQRMKTPL
jgi:hypothetical protein